MYNLSLHKQLIATRTDDMRRAWQGQRGAFDSAITASSANNPQHRDLRLPVRPLRLLARLAH